MAVASDSIPTPARPLLPFADPRTAVEILDDICREVERHEAGCGDITIPSAIRLSPAPAPLPSLPTAFSRRRATFGFNDLTPAQEALQTHRRKELYEILHPETANGGAGRGREKLRQSGEPNDRFTTDTAERTGRSERAVQRDAERGRKLGDDLRRVAGTSLDKGVELDALARLTEEKVAQLAPPLGGEQPANHGIFGCHDLTPVKSGRELGDEGITLSASVVSGLTSDPPLEEITPEQPVPVASYGYGVFTSTASFTGEASRCL